MIKEGQYDAALRQFSQGVKRFPDGFTINEAFFKYLLATKNHTKMAGFAATYLIFLLSNHHIYKLTTSYKQILQLIPGYLPDTAELRFEIAKAYADSGDLETVIPLINGLHKAFPEYGQLIVAYQLLAQALELTPRMAKQAEQCRVFIKRLEKHTQTIKIEEKIVPLAKANFGVDIR